MNEPHSGPKDGGNALISWIANSKRTRKYKKKNKPEASSTNSEVLLADVGSFFAGGISKIVPTLKK